MFSLVDTTVAGGNTLLESLMTTKKKSLQKLENMKNSKENKKNGTSLQPKKVESATDFFPSARCYEILPTKDQKKILNDWFASFRKVWNVAIEHIRQNPSEKIKEETLRDHFVIKKNMSDENIRRLDWTFRTPKRIREYAIKDLISSFKGNFTKLKKRQIRRFRMDTKDKHKVAQTISLPQESSRVRNNTLTVCSLQLKFKHDIEDQEIKSNMRLKREDGKYFIYITTFGGITEMRESREKVVGIDPGLNIFHALYSPNGEYAFVGSDLRENLERMYDKIDSIESSGKKGSKRTVDKVKARIKSMIDDFHWKYVHWRLRNYNRIIIPSLYVRNVNKEIKRLQNDMKHCLFVDRLIYKSALYKNSEIHKCKEHYTTQGCPSCGSRNTVRNKTILCKKCGFEIHRDLGGGTNVTFKSLELKA